MTDFLLVDNGSVVLLTPLSKAAKQWIEENISDDSTWFGRSLAIEPRYVDDILNGITNSNLEVTV